MDEEYGQSVLDREKISSTKEEALKKISELCSKEAGVDAKELCKSYEEREKLDSTGFGSGVAIPHAKLDGYQGGMIGIVKFAEPVDWDSIDGQPVKTTIDLVMPGNDDGNTHLQVISKLMRKLVHQNFIDQLNEITDADELYNFIIKEMED